MKLIIAVCAALVSISTFSQSLTTSQLLSLSDQSLGEMQENLTARKWYFYAATDETKDRLGNARFVYDRPEYVEGGTADFFITYFFSNLQKAQYVEILFGSIDAYENFSKQLDNLGFKVSSSTTKNGNIVKIYEHSGDIVEVTIPPRLGTVKAYKFLFATKKSHRRLGL